MATRSNRKPKEAARCLKSACRRYCYKPYAAFFNAFHVRAFGKTGIDPEQSILDVGCADGSFGVLLADVYGKPRNMTGIEISVAALGKAGQQAKNTYSAMLTANATALPFGDHVFETALFNASLFAVQPGPQAALAETYRVLKPRGRLIVTVCTDRYIDQYWLARIYKTMGLHRLSRSHQRAMDRRMMHSHVYSAAGWESLLKNQGFQIEQHFGFLPLPLCTRWSILTWTPLRVLGGLQLIHSPRLQRLAAALLYRAFRGVFQRTPVASDPDASGYILIEALKNN